MSAAAPDVEHLDFHRVPQDPPRARNDPADPMSIGLEPGFKLKGPPGGQGEEVRWAAEAMLEGALERS